MKNIEIKIATIVDGNKWEFNGKGTAEEKSNRIVLRAEEETADGKTNHQIELGENFVFITRTAITSECEETTTRLEFYSEENGVAYIHTQYGKLECAIETKTFAIKKTTLCTHIILAYLLDFDSNDSTPKKAQITYSYI